MIALDTNVLVYAHREDSEWHEPAIACVTKLAEGGVAWAIPAPCLLEFLAIVSHPKIYRPPTPMNLALDQVDAWRESPALQVLTEGEGYWERLHSLVLTSRVTGAQVHDARVAALCLHHGVAELWTADRDFGRFPDLRTRNTTIDAFRAE